jgi:hypothetical protein
VNRYELQRLKAEELGVFMAAEFRNDLSFIAGCSLYWAEGAKYGNFVFVNCDPNVHRVVKIGFLDKVTEKIPLRIVLHCHPECDRDQALKFWQKIYPNMEQFSAVYCRKKGTSTRVAKWPNGMLSIRSGSLLRRTVQAAIDTLFAC